jgi:hypothetical protein
LISSAREEEKERERERESGCLLLRSSAVTRPH